MTELWVSLPLFYEANDRDRQKGRGKEQEKDPE